MSILGSKSDTEKKGWLGKLKQGLTATRNVLSKRVNDLFFGGGKLDEEMRSSCANSDGVLIVKSGADNKVNRVEFNDIKNLFNANGLAPAEFAQKLAQEHHVPEMKPNDAQTAWTYTSPDGNQIEIITKDVLGISMMRLNMGRAAQ